MADALFDDSNPQIASAPALKTMAEPLREEASAFKLHAVKFDPAQDAKKAKARASQPSQGGVTPRKGTPKSKKKGGYKFKLFKQDKDEEAPPIPLEDQIPPPVVVEPAPPKR